LNILGFDTATPATTVALLTSDGSVAELRDEPQTGSRGEHAESVLVLAAAVLASAGLDWRAVDLIAAGIGPGGYTGLRIGIATAVGLARSTGARVTGVCTLRALAEPLAPAPALALIDARRGELFAAAYRAQRELIAPRVIRPGELGGLIAELDEPALRAVGDGALIARVELAGAGLEPPEDSSELHRVSAAAICRIAARGPLSELAPLYLRRPDAELALGA
jgi:tRNA threonylcarbamoyladenosine biosynthesis protein TsaB